MSGERLPRAWRLARVREMTEVLRAGRRRRTPRLDILWRPNAVGHPRFASIVPRFGQTAVARNRLRRRLTEILRRRILPTLEPMDVVVRSRTGAYRAGLRDLATDLEQWSRTHSG